MKIKLTLLAIFFLHTDVATALTCASPTFDERYESAHEILHIKAIACEFPESMVLKQPLQVGQCPGGKWKVQVKEVFKGETNLNDKELFVFIGEFRSFPYRLKTEEEYVLFLGETRGTGQCSGNFMLNSAKTLRSGESESDRSRQQGFNDKQIHDLRNARDGTSKPWASFWSFAKENNSCTLSGGGVVISYSYAEFDETSIPIEFFDFETSDGSDPKQLFEHKLTLQLPMGDGLPAQSSITVDQQQWPLETFTLKFVVRGMDKAQAHSVNSLFLAGDEAIEFLSAIKKPHEGFSYSIVGAETKTVDIDTSRIGDALEQYDSCVQINSESQN